MITLKNQEVIILKTNLLRPVRKNIEIPDKPWVLEKSTIIGPIGMAFYWLIVCILLGVGLICVTKYYNYYLARLIFVVVLIVGFSMIPFGIYLDSKIKINKNPKGHWVVVHQSDKSAIKGTSQATPQMYSVIGEDLLERKKIKDW